MILTVSSISYESVGIVKDVPTISYHNVGYTRSEKGRGISVGQKRVLPLFLGQKSKGSPDPSAFIYSARSDCQSVNGRFMTAFLEVF